MGVFGAVSFHGTKTLTTGEGGMFVTSDPVLYERTLTLSNHGRRQGETRQFWAADIGFKYKMSNVQAAIGCAQLERVDELVGAKRRIFKYYQAALSDLDINMNPEPAGVLNGFWMPTIVAPEGADFDREELLLRMREANIDGRVFFWPLSSLPMFDAGTNNRGSASLSPRAINLPSYHDLTSAEQDRVIEVVRESFS
jgi:perosamine synthetase